MRKPSPILGIYREQIFSPGKIQQDSAILDATLSKLAQMGYETYALRAETLDIVSPPGLVLSLAQSDRTLGILGKLQEDGIPVINSVRSVRNCYRKNLVPLLQKNGLPVPESRIISLDDLERKGLSFDISTTYWLKRGDVHAIQPEDVVKVKSGNQVITAIKHFRRQDIEDVLVQEHVEGMVVKFYGVGADEYFTAFSASTGEKIVFQVGALSKIARLSAKVVGLEVYGGDAIFTPGGKVALIDLNDWPSFSLCCEPAAEAIAGYTTRLINGGLYGLSK